MSGFTLFVSLAAALGLGTVTSAIVNALVTLSISVEQRKHDLAAREHQQRHERELRVLETRHTLQQARLARLREDAVEMVGIVLELQSEATGASFVPDKALSNAVTISANSTEVALIYSSIR